MLNIFRSDMYRVTHSMSIALLFVSLLVMTLMMFSVSIGSRSVHEVNVAYEDSNEPNKVWGEMVNEASARGYFAKYRIKYYAYCIETSARYLFMPGGELYDQYGGVFASDFNTVMQQIDSDLCPLDEENVYEKWAFPTMLKDNSAIAVSSIIFPIFFFGKDFKNRIFNRSVFAGKSRGQILTARLLTFLILSLLLSMAELCVAMICYIPNVFVLGTGHVLRHMFIRLIIDIGVLSMPVILQFAFRDVLKSTGIYVLLFCLYARYYATHWDSEIPVYLLGTTNNLHPWMENLSFGNFLPIVFTSTVTLIISVSIAYLFFRRSELK